MEAKQPLRVISLQAENLKRISAIEITPNPDDNVVVISGANGAGKTSVLDSIFLTLAGAKAAKANPHPIRDGETAAHATVDLGDFTVTRHWHSDGTETTTKIVVVSKEGANYPSPQKFLDAKLGALSFDPLAFTRKPEREQREDLLDLVELPFDPDVMATERQMAFDTRTEVGRRLRALEGQLAGKPDPGPDVPDEPVDTDAIVASLTEASEQREAKRALLERHEQLERMVGEQEDAIEAMEAELVAARSALSATVDKRDAAMAAYEAAPLPPDTETYRAALAGAQATNEKVRMKAERADLAAQADALMDEVTAHTAKIEELDRTKAKGLEAAAMPVEGLGIDEAGVTYQGIPFAQCSAAEQLRVSLAMAMAANPTIGVIRITDGSLLDPDSMALVWEMATAKDMQVWIERVGAEEGVGFVIEDGTLA